MSSDFKRAIARYETARFEAKRQAALNLQGQTDVDFYIGDWGTRAASALTAQWKDEHASDWDWPEIFRRHKDIDRLDIVIWGPEDRLCGLGLGLRKADFVELRFLERDPRPDCPLIGKIIPIMLECSTCYAQATGRDELRLEPTNDQLATLYKDTYGFTVAKDRKGQAYCQKRVKEDPSNGEPTSTSA